MALEFLFLSFPSMCVCVSVFVGCVLPGGPILPPPPPPPPPALSIRKDLIPPLEVVADISESFALPSRRGPPRAAPTALGGPRPRRLRRLPALGVRKNFRRGRIGGWGEGGVVSFFFSLCNPRSICDTHEWRAVIPPLDLSSARNQSPAK